MEGYLGEFPADLTTSVYFDYEAIDWAIHWIEQYGQIDGEHHETWVLDQIARILYGTKVIVTEARWKDGKTELRFKLADPPSEEYADWVEEMTGDGEYEYDTGIAP